MRTPLGPARVEMFTTEYWTEGDHRSIETGIPHTDATGLLMAAAAAPPIADTAAPSMAEATAAPSMDAAAAILMDDAAIRDFNAAILADPAFCRTDVCHMVLPDPASRDAFVTYNLSRPAYAEAAPLVRDNILGGLRAFADDYEIGVCIARSVLLSLPIEGEWPTYKPFTLSPIHVNEGVIVYSVTADRKWYFVRTAIYYGWVSSKCIALADSREEMKGYTDYKDFLVVTADHLTVAVGGETAATQVVCDADNCADNHAENHLDNHAENHADNRAENHADNHAENHAYNHADKTCITYDMGDRIRLTSHDAQGYHVTVLIKGDDGHVSAAEAIIDESADVHVGYLPYTQKNLLDQCFKTLDDRYMWGGGEGERDCSSWVMEIFSCFGLIFPRNSARQAKIPAYSLNLSGIDNELKSEILSHLPAGTLIFSPSHVMVYLGRRGNDNYMIHNGGDFRVIKDTRDFRETSDMYDSHATSDSYGRDKQATDKLSGKNIDESSEKHLTYGVTVMSLEKTTTLGGRVWLDAIISAVFPYTSDKYSVLVDKTHAFDESYLDRVRIINRMSVYGEERAIEEETSRALDELIAFADTMGIKIGFCSGYRSVAYQQKMLETYPEIYGDDFRPELIAQPGYSEHHTGLAVDLAIYWDGRWVEDNYPDEAVAALEKLHPHLHSFGFILRYPEGLEDTTGYPYEPWHIRYVGKSAAPAYFISGRHLPFEQLSCHGDGSPGQSA